MTESNARTANSNSATDIAPWYRQPWFWFVMSPLILVVCVSLSFVTVSVFYADDRVVDNYYQQGRTINQSFAQDTRARELELAAELRFDQQTGEVLVQLEGQGQLPQELQLLIGHPINAEADQSVALKELRDGYYRGDLSGPLSHRRYLTLLPAEGAGQIREADWLLRGEIDFERGQSLQINPTEPPSSEPDPAKP